MTFPIESHVPLNFEYEFVFKTPHPDISIHPLKGVIPGKGLKHKVESNLDHALNPHSQT
jgi:hypothetical protein